MNYRHAFHAGNFADVLKHAVLARILAHLSRKEAPWRLLDTHAGTGLYDLASDEALRTGEWQGGIGRLVSAIRLDPALATFLAPYLAAVEAVNGGGALLVYPGSPMIAAALARPQDRIVLCELHPADGAEAGIRFGSDRRIRVLREDGWIAVRSQLPPPERRGLVLVDPPFEEPGEFDRLGRAFSDAAKRFSTGIVIGWYPIKSVAAVDTFHAVLAASGLTKLLRIELWTRTPGGEGPLAGTGLIVMNPPFRLYEDCRDALAPLCERLADGPGAGHRIDWLVPETQRSRAEVEGKSAKP